MTFTPAPLRALDHHHPKMRLDRRVYLCGAGERFTQHLARHVRFQIGWLHVTCGHVLIEASVLYQQRLYHLQAHRPPGGPFESTWTAQTEFLSEPTCAVQTGRTVTHQPYSYLILPGGEVRLR